MIALTVKNGHTRIYLTDGTAAGGGPTARSPRTSGGRTTASQSAATLLASQTAVSALGCVARPATHTFPASYTRAGST